MEAEKKLYVVVSQTGSIVSKILKLLTGARYNHVSVALDATLTPMYSFARKYTYNPFWGAFVKEYPGRGALGRFKNTEVVVLELNCSSEQYDAVAARLEKMYREREKYRYNYRGLFSAYFSKKYHKKHHYYCSEFVRDLLERSGIIPENSFGDIAKPIDFLRLPQAACVYCGRLRKYRPPTVAPQVRAEACGGGMSESSASSAQPVSSATSAPVSAQPVREAAEAVAARFPAASVPTGGQAAVQVVEQVAVAAVETAEAGAKQSALRTAPRGGAQNAAYAAKEGKQGTDTPADGGNGVLV